MNPAVAAVAVFAMGDAGADFVGEAVLGERSDRGVVVEEDLVGDICLDVGGMFLNGGEKREQVDGRGKVVRLVGSAGVAIESIPPGWSTGDGED